MNYGFLIDNRKCIGCHACSVACKAENQVPVGAHRTWVKYVEKGEFPDVRRLFTVTRCNHCANPPCVYICPVTALYQRPDGIVDLDQGACIGCKACMQACPYDALYIHPDKGTAEKCHYCAHRVEKGLEPPCVVVCPERAIVAGDLDDPGSEIARLLAREATTVRKPEQGTKPKLFYIEGDAAALTPAVAPPARSYMWSATAEERPGGFFLERPTARAESRWTGTGAAGLPGAGAAGSLAFPPTACAPLAAPEARLLEVADVIRTGYAPARRVTRRSRVRRTHDVTHEKPWGASVAAYVFTKSVAAGAFLVALALPLAGHAATGDELQLIAALVSLVALGVTSALLVADLERPDRFFTVLTRPQWRSWLAIGAWVLAAYGGLLVLWTLLALLRAEGALALLAVPGALLAAAAAVYTAFLFGQAEGRDFWQSPALAPGLLLHALVAGSAVLAPVAMVLGRPEAAAWLARFLVLALAADLVVILLGELYTRHASADAALAARLIRSGPYAWPFWSVAVGLGHVGAAVLLLALPAAVDSLAAASLLALLGLATWSHCFLEAGQAPPLS